MRHFLLFLFFFSSTLLLKSQDYIVVNGSDTIHCKINEINSTTIFFTIQQNNIPLKSSIPLSKASSFYFNNNQTEPLDDSIKISTTPTDKYVNTNDNILKGKELPYRFRVTADIGYGFLLAETHADVPSFLDNYYDELKSGIHYSFGANYFFKKNWGIGIKSSIFKTNNQFNNLVINFPDGSSITGVLKDDITINYIGASVFFRLPAKNRVSGLFIELTLGKTFYKNNSVFIYGFDMSSSTTSFGYGIGYDFKVTNFLSIGIGYDNNIASLDKMIVNDQTYYLDKPEEKENISRGNLFAGLRFLLQ